LIITPALLRIEHGIAMITHREGYTPFNTEERDKKEAQVMIDPFYPDVGMPADRAGPGLSFYNHGFRLHTTNQKEHITSYHKTRENETTGKVTEHIPGKCKLILEINEIMYYHYLSNQ